MLPSGSNLNTYQQQPNQYYGYPNLNNHNAQPLQQPISQIYNNNNLEQQPQIQQPQQPLYPLLNQFQQSTSPQQQPFTISNLNNDPNLQHQVQGQQGLQQGQQQGQGQQQQQQQVQQQQVQPQVQENTNNETLKANFNKEAEIKKLFEQSYVSIKNSVQKTEMLGSPMPFSRKLDPQQNYNDYQTISSMMLEKFIPFPSEITQRLHSTASVSALFGIFPEINRVWISIDNILFLWNYANNKFKYVHFSHVINNAYLMAPKKDIFTEGVSKMVVICTYAEIFLNPIRDDEECDIQLGLSIPTDGIKITSIVGTKDGRVYFAGDGHIYEIEYSRNSFSYYRNELIRKVNRTASFLSSFWTRKRPDIIQLQFDDKKNNLYALTIDSKLLVYSVKGGTFTEVNIFDPCKDYLSEPRSQSLQNQQQSLQQQQFQNQNQFVQQQFQNQNQNQPFGQQQFQNQNPNPYQQQQQIQLQPQQNQAQKNTRVNAISIHLTSDDERFADVLVVLSNGVRLYYQSSNQFNNNSNQPQYQYLRLPPNSMILTNSPNNTIHQAFYSKGVFITSSEIEESTDRVTGVSLFNLSQIKKSLDQSIQIQDSIDHFCEKPNFINISGRVIDIKEEINLSYNSLNTPYYKDLIIEHSITPRRFLLLSASGISIITKLRYTDILQQLLSNNRQMEVDYLYGELGQVIANSLLIELYCLSPKSTIISNEAQLYGNISLPKIAKSGVSDLALSFIKKYSTTPVPSQPQQHANSDLGFAVNNAQYNNSSVYLGLLAYTGRVMSMFWNQPMILANGNCKWSINQLKIYQSHLLSLLSFMEITGLAPSITIPSNDLNIPIENDRIQTSHDALLREKRAIIGLRELLLQSIQVLNLFIIFQEDNNTKPNFLNIMKDFKRNISFAQYSFSNYVDDIKQESPLIPALIDGFLKRLVDFNYKIDSYSNRLTQECPCFYKQEDKEFQRVKQYFAEALNGINYQSNIQAAIEILLQISPNYSYNDVIKSLIGLEQISQITPLLLQYISRLESQQLQPQLFKQEENQKSSSSNKMVESEDTYNKKVKIYQEIVQLLDSIYQKSRGSGIGEQTINEIISLTLSFIGNKQSGFEFKSDTLVLEGIYNWILTQNGISKIMELDYSQSPYLVEYLKKSQPQLSWKYLQKNKKYYEAADILFQIAENSTQLDEKIQCYSDAQLILNETNVDAIQFQDAKFLLFLAKIQKIIIQEISNKNETVNRELETDLLDLNQLFEISKEHCLHEPMLLIANYGHHDDEKFFVLLWKIIINNVVQNFKEEKEKQKIGDLDNLAKNLQDKIIKYGIQLKYPNETSFPVKSIILCTETEFFSVKSDQFKTPNELVPSIQSYDWLARSLHDSVGIDYWILVDIYKNIVEDPIWNKKEGLVYIISVFVNLLESLINSTSSNFSERRVFASKQFRSTILNFSDKLIKFKGDENNHDLNNLLKSIERINPVLLTLENSY